MMLDTGLKFYAVLSPLTSVTFEGPENKKKMKKVISDLEVKQMDWIT